MEGDAIVSAGKIFVTTNLSAAVATVTVMIITWVRYKKPDVSMSLNGSLAVLRGILPSRSVWLILVDSSSSFYLLFHRLQFANWLLPHYLTANLTIFQFKMCIFAR